jgi:hypothetical protein
MTLDGNANNNKQFQSGIGTICLIHCQGNNIFVQGNKLMGWGPSLESVLLFLSSQAPYASVE